MIALLSMYRCIFQDENNRKVREQRHDTQYHRESALTRPLKSVRGVLMLFRCLSFMQMYGVILA